MAERGRAPEALFVRQVDTVRHQGASFLGLLVLLQPDPDPECLAASLTPRLGRLDDLPPDGAVMPIWWDEADAWDCDAQTLAEMRGQLEAAAVMLVAIVEDSLGERQVVYRPLPGDLVVDARVSLNAALGEAMN
jgi:hypothetical protein